MTLSFLMLFLVNRILDDWNVAIQTSPGKEGSPPSFTAVIAPADLTAYRFVVPNATAGWQDGQATFEAAEPGSPGPRIAARYEKGGTAEVILSREDLDKSITPCHFAAWNGTGWNLKVVSPTAVVFDPAGNAYVLDEKGVLVPKAGQVGQ